MGAIQGSGLNSPTPHRWNAAPALNRWLGSPCTAAIVLALALSTGPSGVLAQVEGNSDSRAVEAEPGPATFKVRAESLESEVTVGGNVVPYREITFSAQIPGRVVRLAGKEGTRVERGQLIVALDQQELLARRRQLETQMRSAEAALQNASVQYQRELSDPAPTNMMQQMFGPMGNVFGGQSPAARQARLFELRTQILNAQNSLAQARFALQELDAKLRDARSVAPFDGVIMDCYIEQGDPVQPGQPLVSLGDTEYLQLQADLAARLALALPQGTQVTARLDDPDKTLVRVRVNQVFPAADPSSNTIRVKFDLPKGSPVAPGMYAEVLIPDTQTSDEEFLVVPREAVTYRGGLPMVRVLRPQGGTELRLLRLGEPFGEGMVTVLTGLRAGEEVVLSR